MDFKQRLMETLIDIVSVPGISGTESEKLTSKKIYDILETITYFQKHPDNLKLVKINKDPLERDFVYALFQGPIHSNKTVIITGHFDVVGVEEFGHLKDIAFNPVEYTKRVSELTLDEDAKKDLASGDWLFGRGVVDMKFGIALGIEMLRKLSQKDDFEGNILYVAVPAEETNSEGMLGAVPYIIDIQERYGLEYSGLLLPEPYIHNSPEDTTRHIHVGACGKIMPLFFFAGKETHVSYPFGGLNPNLLASEVNRLFEVNSEFCTNVKGVTTPPPVCLKQMDLKELYSVQTPIYAASYYNLITLNLAPEILIKKMKDLSTQAFRNALEIINRNRKVYEEASSVKASNQNITPVVMTYSELYDEVKKIYGSEFDSYIEGKIKAWEAEKKDMQTIAVYIVKETYEKYPNKLPMIIIGFAPPYYPDRYPAADDPVSQNFFSAIDDIIDYAKTKYNDDMVKEAYFMGICDMSYTGLNENMNIEKISSNLLGLGCTYSFPAESLKKLDIPGIVLGVHGKDMHKYSERLNIPYAFDILPDLYEYAIKRILQNA